MSCFIARLILLSFVLRNVVCLGGATDERTHTHTHMNTTSNLVDKCASRNPSGFYQIMQT